MWKRAIASGGSWPVLPQRVRARERGVAAQRDFDGRREPAQIERPVGPADEERGLGEVHLLRDVLHPRLVACRREHTDGGGIAGERLGGEGVDLGDGHGPHQGKRQNDDNRTARGKCTPGRWRLS